MKYIIQVIVILGVGIGAIWIASRFVEESNCTIESTTLLKSLERFSPLHTVTSKIGSIPYDVEYADCYDHAKLMTAELEKENIKSSIFVNEDRSHVYVAVWIEPNTGRFVLPYNDAQILEIRDGSNVTNVQCYNNQVNK